jgi:uncharacterized protein YbaA (DUF1428 family)
MPQYVDGFLLPVPKKNLAAYKKMALKTCKIWLENGALEYRECVAEDFTAKMGTSYKKMLGLKPSETAVFAFVTYKSRKHRDEVNAKVMKDKRLEAMCPNPKDMPFDVGRMGYGGFESIVYGAKKSMK